MSTDKFYTHRKWRTVRDKVLARDGRYCRICGSEEKPEVDHILPRSTHPELEYDESNLQVLCSVHNNQKRAKTNEIIRIDYIDERFFQNS